MGWFRRYALVVSIALVPLAVQVVPAAGSANGPTAGTTANSVLNADFQYDPMDGSMPQITISISDLTGVVRPLGGVATTTSEIDLNLSLFDSETNSYGCFLIGASDFTIASDLSSASVHTVLSDSTPVCAGYSASAVFPISIDVTWTGIGPLSSYRRTGHSACTGFHEEDSFSLDGNPAAATATVSSDLITGSFDSTGSTLSSGDGQSRREGEPAPLCAIGGIGSGPGGLPAGTYKNSNGGASQQLTDDATGEQSLQITVSQLMSSSNPRVGPSTKSTTTNVQLNLYGPDSSAYGCFVIDPGDFTMSQSLSSASLHTTITEANVPCGFRDNDFSALPLTIDMTWTGIGPAATVDNNTLQTCGSLRSQTTDTQQNNNTSSVATISGGLTGSFASHQSANESTGGMGFEDTLTQVQGVAAAGCGL